MKNNLKTNKQREIPTYYGNLPAEVRYSKQLTASEKILYCEFAALSNQKGYAWASNSYFAEIYDVEATTVSDWIQNLKKYGFISIANPNGRSRKITLLPILRKKPKVIKEPIEKAEAQPKVIPETNNTSINTTRNTIPAEAETQFSSKEYFESLVNHKNRFVVITAVFSLKKKKYLQLHTKKQCDAFIYGRNIRVSKRLVDFTDKQILAAMTECEQMNIKGQKVDWSLETVEKQLTK